MNYYIDFDNTLYETAKLTALMLGSISKGISEKTGKDANLLFEEAKANFNSTLDNIFTFAEGMSKKYQVDSNFVVSGVNEVIDNGQNLVFDDAKRFLERLKKNGDKAFILTYLPKTNQEYQMRKIMGSGLGKYFDGIMMTTELKFLLDINYQNGIFIDDDPRDLNGLANKNPIRVIRMRKKNNKRSKIDMNNPKVEEYTSFDDIQITRNKDQDVER